MVSFHSSLTTIGFTSNCGSFADRCPHFAPCLQTTPCVSWSTLSLPPHHPAIEQSRTICWPLPAPSNPNASSQPHMRPPPRPLLLAVSSTTFPISPRPRRRPRQVRRRPLRRRPPQVRAPSVPGAPTPLLPPPFPASAPLSPSTTTSLPPSPASLNSASTPRLRAAHPRLF